MTSWRIGRSCESFDTMSALDATFLDIESDRTPMHVGALSIFDGDPFRDADGRFRLEQVRDHVAGRLHLVPGLRRRTVTSWGGTGRPVWVDDDEFNIERHVQLRHLPQPGDDRQLAALCSELQMATLDRRHPLWELWFIDGLEDGSVALVEKIHHAMVDGVSDVDVAAALLDLSANEPPASTQASQSAGVISDWNPRPAPNQTQLLVHSGVEMLAAPGRWLARSASLLARPSELIAGVGGIADALWSLQRSEHPVRTSLDRSVGTRRSLRWVRRPLAALIEAAHVHEVTLNDLALSAVAAGQRRLLDGRGELPVGSDPLALVPVSTRAPDGHDAAGNQVAALLIPLPVDLDSPDDRLAAVRAATEHHKAAHVADGTSLLVDAMDAVPAAALRQASRLVHRQPLVDAVVTNIAGPPFPLFFDGARMALTVPIVPLAGNLSLSVAILSYDGEVTLGVFADADACPDIDVFVDGIADELDRLIRGPGAAA